MANWFGDLDLGAKYGIILGSLVLLVFLSGFIKLCLIRQKAKKFHAEAKAKAANEEGKTEQIALTRREEDEGDLFGIRALERGFTGGVAQSRPTTPNTMNRSTSTLVPSTVNIPFGQKSSGSLAGSSRSEPISMLTIDVGNPRGVTHSNGGRTSPRADGTVDMQLIVPESPSMPHSPDSTKAPSLYNPYHSSPNLRSASGVSNVSIPSGNLGMQFGQDGSVSPRMLVNAPTPIVTGSSRGMTAQSDSASFVDEGGAETPPSPSVSSNYRTSLENGNSTSYGSRSESPTSPPRTYQGHKPSIRVNGPASGGESSSTSSRVHELTPGIALRQ